MSWWHEKPSVRKCPYCDVKICVKKRFQHVIERHSRNFRAKRHEFHGEYRGPVTQINYAMKHHQSQEQT